MRFPTDSPVTSAKLEALRAQLARLKIDLNLVDENFIKASGPGGQKVNKTSSGVQLRYAALDIGVKWTRERSRGLNRFLALRELADQIELRISPATSKRAQEFERIRKQKDRRCRR